MMQTGHPFCVAVEAEHIFASLSLHDAFGLRPSLSSTWHPVTPTSILGHRILAFSADVVGPRQAAAKQDCGEEQTAQRGAAATARLDRGDGARPR